MSSLFGIPLDAAYHVISAFLSFLTPLFGGLAAAAAIVAFTVAVRLLLMPLSYRALRGLDSQTRIAPQVQAVRSKHAANPERLQRELTALYRAEGTTMFAGCLPILLQWPFLSVMYLLFRSPVIAGMPNLLLTHDLLGAPLSSHWLSGAGPFSAEGAVFAGLFALLAVIGWATARLTRRSAPTAAASGGSGLASPVMSAATWLTPYLTAAFAMFLPLAAGLYLATTTAWTLGERTILRRLSASDQAGQSGAGQSGAGQHPGRRRTALGEGH